MPSKIFLYKLNFSCPIIGKTYAGICTKMDEEFFQMSYLTCIETRPRGRNAAPFQCQKATLNLSRDAFIK